jgi:hypothetical protein
MTMTDDQFRERLKFLVAEEAKQPEEWLYLSFVSDHKFLGAIVMKGHGFVSVVQRCHALGINPGGEVACLELKEANLPPEQYRNRLLSKKELEESSKSPLISFGELRRSAGKPPN